MIVPTCTARSRPEIALRLVGDPVDVIDGCQHDCALDIKVAWPLPLEWRRYYRSQSNNRRLALGWGHTHEYDRYLSYTIDGVRLHVPSGDLIDFPIRAENSGWIEGAGARIRRTAPTRFLVKVPYQPYCEFEFAPGAVKGCLTEMYHRHGRLTFRHDQAGRLMSIQGPGSAVVQVTTGANHLITQLLLRDPGEQQSIVLWDGHYDGHDNLVRVKDAYGATQAFSYDAQNRMTRNTNRVGYSFFFKYDNDNRCISSGGEDGVQLINVHYRPAEGTTAVTRADDGQWQYFFNERKQITLIVDALGGARHFDYDEAGNLAQEIDPRGTPVRTRDVETSTLVAFAAPRFSMVLARGDAWAAYVRTHYTPRHSLAWEWMAANLSTWSIRMPSREILRTKNLPAMVLAGLQTAPTPEAERPAIRRVSRLKPVVTVPSPGWLSLDRYGRLVSYHDFLGGSRRWQYDANGNVIRWVDEAGSIWRNEHGSWNLLRAAIDPLGQTTRFDHDLMEQIIKVTDPGLTATEQKFDKVGDLLERQRYGKKIHEFSYDAARNLVRWSALDQSALKFTPGTYRRPVEVKIENQQRKCAYNDRGRLVEVVTRCEEKTVETLSFSYGLMGDLVADLRDEHGVTRSFKGERLVRIEVLGRYQIAYEYKGPGEVSIVDPSGRRHMLSNLGSGLFLRQLSSGVEELGQYDWDGRCLAKIRFDRYDVSKLWRRSYRYTAVGALEEEQIHQAPARLYKYDAAHRLVQESTAGMEYNYRYDPAGNLLTIPGVGELRYHHNRLVSAVDRTVSYNAADCISDIAGRPERQTLRYDAENQLSAVEEGTHSTRFSYDALGRRITKEHDGQTTRFVWDGERLTAEIAPNGRVRVYVYADAGARSPILFTDYDNETADPALGRTYYVFSNQIACPIRIEDQERRVVWQAQISPYGAAEVVGTSEIEFNLRWPGHYFDSETGLNYNRHRYYSPELGRYIQPDPLDWPAGINVYAYSARPLDTVDIDGLAPCPPKALGDPLPEDHPMRRRADELSEELKGHIDEQGLRGTGTTASVFVVKRAGSDEFEIVVTVNGRGRLSEDSQQMLAEEGVRVVRVPPTDADGRSTRVTSAHDGTDGEPNLRFPRERRDGEVEDTTHHHAEQRGLRALDCDDGVENVVHVAPTRPCCEGCSAAIQDRGGVADNVSDRGVGNGQNW